MINSNLTKILNLTIEAINTTGRDFKEIDKKVILDFLSQNFEKNFSNKISKDDLKIAYRYLEDFYYNKNKSNVSDMIKSVVDYNDTSHNDVKVREPRKSIFSEIKKIAG
jgi:hypothetical protein